MLALHLHCRKCTFVVSGCSAALTSTGHSGLWDQGPVIRTETSALQTASSQKDRESFHLPSFLTLFSHLAEAPVPTSWQGFQSVRFPWAFLFSPRQLIQLHYTPHTLTSLASTRTLPIPNSGSIQHSVYSASLSKLPDTPVENQTIVLIGAVTNSSVFSSAEHPPLPPLPCAL